MRGEPSMEEWEQTLSADLPHHLMPARQLRWMRPPPDVNWLPDGAQVALVGGIGRHGLEELLVVPPSARTYGWQRQRCIYTPTCVLGVGERAAALWVRALPVPGVRVLVPVSEIAAITWQTNGQRGQLLITGRTGRLPVRYDAASDASMGTWIRRLRRHAAGDPAPVPPGYPCTRDAARGSRRYVEPAALRLDSDDEVVMAGRPGRAGRGTCLLALTSRELVILRSLRSANPRGRLADTLYVPRRVITAGSIQSGSLLLRSAGVDLRIGLSSRKAAGAASAWLEQVLNDRDRTGTSP